MRSTAIHDTLSKGSVSWIYLIIFIIKLVYYSAAYAQPQGKQMPDRDTRIWKPFLVDLKINQQNIGSAFVWQHEDGKYWLLPVDLLQRSRVRIPSTAPRVVQESIDYVSTASLGKVESYFSEENQTLSIDFASSAFEASSIKVPINSLAGIPSMVAGNRSGGLVGMVTTDDLLDLLAAELSMLAGLVVEQPIKEERTRK